MATNTAEGEFWSLLDDAGTGHTDELPRRPRRLGWWLARIGREEPIASERCATKGCTTAVSSVDVYCPDEEHPDFLLFRDTPVWAKYASVTALAGAIIALLMVAASRDSSWPVSLLAVFVGTSTIGLVLHAHRIGRIVGIVVWLGMSAGTALILSTTLHGRTMAGIWTIAVGLPLAGVLAIGVSADVGGAKDDGSFSIISVPMLVALVALLARWLTAGRYAEHFSAVPAGLSRTFLYVGLVLGWSPGWSWWPWPYPSHNQGGNQAGPEPRADHGDRQPSHPRERNHERQHTVLRGDGRAGSGHSRSARLPEHELDRAHRGSRVHQCPSSRWSSHPALWPRRHLPVRLADHRRRYSRRQRDLHPELANTSVAGRDPTRLATSSATSRAPG